MGGVGPAECNSSDVNIREVKTDYEQFSFVCWGCRENVKFSYFTTLFCGLSVAKK